MWLPLPRAPGPTVRAAGDASSEGAVVQLPKVLALEFAFHNVHVNALAPAYFATPLVRQVMEDEAWYENVVGRVAQRALRRALGDNRTRLIPGFPGFELRYGNCPDLRYGWTAV